MKHAYLIIASNNPKQLQTLITMLDDSKNDIYLLEDKKSNLISYRFQVNYSTIYYLKPINIYWGSYSQIDAELRLLRASVPEKYGYYHIMSDQDLPLYNQDYIHNFFDQYSGHEFIQYQSENKKEINNKLHYHLFTKYFDAGINSEHGRNNYIIKLIITIYRRLESMVNSRIKERRIPYSKVSTASTWMSIDNKLAALIVKSNDWIYSHFNHGLVVDEMFIPTLINYYPDIFNKVWDKTEYSISPAKPMSNLTYIRKDAIAAHPKTWTIKDYYELIKARKKGYLYSRKFNIDIDNKIIDKIFNYVMN